MHAPRRKRLNRGKRLNIAAQWISAYSGSNLIRGYCTWFGVSEVCAIVELRMLGIEIAESRLDQARRNEQARAARRKQRRQERADPDGCEDGLWFVAGYTPAGAPYGIDQDDADAAWEQESALSRALKTMYQDDDLPF
ncbi:hypothetical protein [Longimicrobium sp.]|uniref:hypothetical protein n=1 Tax=Longimicrobium sp. TaxID=2029185 RepID=UPI002E37A5B2|nr:hypothetical protein [Longimicrobium sp.]HEX6039216.1 hypothetical protein [Longimicrobium sp.]